MSYKTAFIIDAGHVAKYNKGVVNGYYEGNAMWELSGYLVNELLKYKDIDVIKTRKSISDNKNAYARGQEAAETTGYDELVYLTLHSNAMSNNSSTCGTVVFRSLYKPNNQKLGEMLAKAVADVMRPVTKNTYSRGCLSWDDPKYPNYDYHVNTRGYMLNANSFETAKKTNVTYGYIIEHGFHSNVAECRFMMNSENLKKIARAEADTLAKYFGLKLKEEPKPPVSKPEPTPIPPQTVKTYTVKRGDSWWGIAASQMGNGTKYEELAAFNGMTKNTTIHAGRVLKIPSNEVVIQLPVTKTYTVKRGDSWWGIAHREMGSWKRQSELAKFNGKTLLSFIYAGEVLKIPV